MDWMAAIRMMMREENETSEQKIIIAMEARMSMVETRVDGLDKRLEEVEKKLGEQASSSSGDVQANFKPSYLEIKGFCAFNERLTKGVKRTEADIKFPPKIKFNF